MTFTCLLCGVMFKDPDLLWQHAEEHNAARAQQLRQERMRVWRAAQLGITLRRKD